MQHASKSDINRDIPNCSQTAPAAAPVNNERVTLIVVVITLVTMVVEIAAGILSGSMALLSDGIHMGTHAVALFITLFAYIFARRQSANPAFSFGTGKVGVLGGYTNAILLLIAGGAMAVESVERLMNPVQIHFNEAITVAVIGLGVNLISALILGHGSHEHSHHHGPGGHSQDHAHQDHNLKAAYLHVITDALTSVLAIAALIFAKYFGLVWADPAVAILGGLVVIRWAVGLLRQTAGILLDKGDFSNEISTLKSHLETGGTRVSDIHIWQNSENRRSLILSIETPEPRTPEEFRQIISRLGRFDHITIEVNPAG